RVHSVCEQVGFHGAAARRGGAVFGVDIVEEAVHEFGRGSGGGLGEVAGDPGIGEVPGDRLQEVPGQMRGGDRVFVDDLVAAHAEEVEQERSDHPGPVLAGGAVEDHTL